MIGKRRFVVAKETVDFIHNNFPLKYAPSANPEYACMRGLMQRNQAVQKDSVFSDDSGDVDQGIIAALIPLQELVASSQSFSKLLSKVVHPMNLIPWISIMRLLIRCPP